MNSNYKFNYVFVMYDVEEKTCPKIFKICKKYLSHYQNSIFRGEITQAQLIHLRREISNLVDENTDYVSIIKLRSKSTFAEEELGKKTNEYDELFL